MSGKKKFLLGLIVFVLFLVAAGFGYKRLRGVVKPQSNLTTTESSVEEKKEDETKSGQQKAEKEKVGAPDFMATDADGNQMKLSDFVGKPIVLNFWASWCPPCKEEMPVFNKLYEEMGSEIVFVMVDMVDGQRETLEKGKAHIESQGFTFPVYYDTLGDANRAYGVSSLPTTLFIDKEGNIAIGAQGAIDEETLRKGIGYITETAEEETK